MSKPKTQGLRTLSRNEKHTQTFVLTLVWCSPALVGLVKRYIVIYKMFPVEIYLYHWLAGFCPSKRSNRWYIVISVRASLWGGRCVMAALGEQLWLNKAITGRKQQPFNWKELNRTLEYLGITNKELEKLVMLHRVSKYENIFWVCCRIAIPSCVFFSSEVVFSCLPPKTPKHWPFMNNYCLDALQPTPGRTVDASVLDALAWWKCYP